MEPTVTNPDPEQLRRAGRHGEAVAAYRQALTTEPGNPRLLIPLGLCLHELRHFDEAVDALRQAVALAPGVFAAHYNLAVVLAEQLRTDEAIQAYRAALAIEPHPYALINLGLLLRNLGRNAEAVDHLRQAAAAAPELPQAHLNLAATLLMLGDSAPAIAAIRKTLELAPNAAEAHAMLAQALVHAGDPAGAAEACRRALSLDPTQMAPRAFLAVLLQALGRLDDAAGLIDYARAISGERFMPPAAPSSPHWPNLAAFNRELADVIRKDPTLRGDRPTATHGGAQTLEILDRADRSIVAIRKFFEQAVQRYISGVLPGVAAPIPIPAPPQWRLGGWGVVLNSGGYQIPHFHPSAVLSGVYYVQVPLEMSVPGAGTAGHISFGSPPQEILKMMSGPTGREAFLRTATIKPEEGLLILFPSYLWHHTLPLEAAEDRISLAFDVNPVVG